MQTENGTLYDVLEVAADAPDSVIAASYKRLRKTWHPDLNQDRIREATERFKRIQQAWGVLGDRASRAGYDATLAAERPPPTKPEGPGWWEPEIPVRFRSTKPGPNAPMGFATPPIAGRGLEAAAPQTPRAPTGARMFPAVLRPIVTARVDGMSVARALGLNALGLGILWWLYALVRHRSDRLYWAVGAVIGVLFALSFASDAAGLAYWVLSFAAAVFLVARRHHVHPALATGSAHG